MPRKTSQNKRRSIPDKKYNEKQMYDAVKKCLGYLKNDDKIMSKKTPQIKHSRYKRLNIRSHKRQQCRSNKRRSIRQHSNKRRSNRQRSNKRRSNK